MERAYQQDLSNISTTLSAEQKASKTSATDWMEWHTQSLAPKIMMPRKMFKLEADGIIKHLVEKVKQRITLILLKKLLMNWLNFLVFQDFPQKFGW
ncbi:hypothetical protein AAFF39_04995 [Lactococcus garvieae]